MARSGRSPAGLDHWRSPIAVTDVARLLQPSTAVTETKYPAKLQSVGVLGKGATAGEMLVFVSLAGSGNVFGGPSPTCVTS
jgi:hypothetical protein